MNITRFSIKRPIGICMIYILVCVLGLISFFRIGVELLPDVDSKFISVIVNYPGASTESVEQQVTKRLRTSCPQFRTLSRCVPLHVPDVRRFLSSWTVRPMLIWWLSRQRKKVSRIRKNLPEDIDEPAVLKRLQKNIRLSRLQQRLRIIWTIFLLGRQQL